MNDDEKTIETAYVAALGGVANAILTLYETALLEAVEETPRWRVFRRRRALERSDLLADLYAAIEAYKQAQAAAIREARTAQDASLN